MMKLDMKTLGASCLVTGTSIGAGMLAMPVLTAESGFILSIITYLCGWFCMMVTGLFYCEIYLWFPYETNLVSMSQELLGKYGKLVCSCIYVILFYSLVIAYIAAGADIVRQWVVVSPILAATIFVLVFGSAMWIGDSVVDRLNRLLTVGLLSSFAIFLVLGWSQVHVERLATKGSWFTGLPVVILAFGFQGIVPTLTHYLKRDARKVQKAILMGSILTLVCYISWQALILGAIPPLALQYTKLQGLTAIAPFRQLILSPWILKAAHSFAFFALVTSFLGVTLGLLDFLADGLRIKKNLKGRAILSSFIFIPSLCGVYLEPKLFLLALEYGGAVGGIALLLLLPIIMLHRGRYYLHKKGPFTTPGGKGLLYMMYGLALLSIIVLSFSFRK